jgi:hypothetical protein
MARQQNIAIDQGTDFTADFTVTNADGDLYDFSGFTFEAKLRKHYDSANGVSFTANSGSVGVITLSLSRTASSNLVAGRYVYDVEGTSSANVTTRFVEGICTLRPQVTK